MPLISNLLLFLLCLFLALLLSVRWRGVGLAVATLRRVHRAKQGAPGAAAIQR
jgi:hypothetical protein